MNETDSIKMLVGKSLSHQLSNEQELRNTEFSVFSQFGDDGIIQYLIKKIKSITEYFIEFGVENYLESNTRFLLQNNNWSGLILDGSKELVSTIMKQQFYWKHDLTAVNAFINAENINDLLSGSPSQPGLLHIDIDGNDYWIWKAIKKIEADIVIMEYNSVFGSERAITIPYYSDFNRAKYHYSNLYAGASITALCDLAEDKGYLFIGSNSAGNNAYFVKKEKAGNLKPLSVKEGFVLSKFRESRDRQGNLTYLSGNDRLREIKGLEVYNTRTNKIEIL
ncbi:hypothetical protein BH11BAC5_BH11BAC5_30040 [soil metagenome]